MKFLLFIIIIFSVLSSNYKNSKIKEDNLKFSERTCLDIIDSKHEEIIDFVIDDNVSCNIVEDVKDQLYVEIPDSNFEKIFDSVIDGKVRYNLVSQIKLLQITGNKHLTSLEGIQEFQKLEILNISWNPKLKSIDLTKNKNLKRVYNYQYQTEKPQLEVNKNISSFDDGFFYDIKTRDYNNYNFDIVGGEYNKKLALRTNTIVYDKKQIQSSIDVSEKLKQKTIANLKLGTIVTIVETKAHDKWVKISFDEEKTGWIKKENISPFAMSDADGTMFLFSNTSVALLDNHYSLPITYDLLSFKRKMDNCTNDDDDYRKAYDFYIDKFGFSNKNYLDIKIDNLDVKIENWNKKYGESDHIIHHYAGYDRGNNFYQLEYDMQLTGKEVKIESLYPINYYHNKYNAPGKELHRFIDLKEIVELLVVKDNKIVDSVFFSGYENPNTGFHSVKKAPSYDSCLINRKRVIKKQSALYGDDYFLTNKLEKDFISWPTDLKENTLYTSKSGEIDEEDYYSWNNAGGNISRVNNGSNFKKMISYNTQGYGGCTFPEEGNIFFWDGSNIELVFNFSTATGKDCSCNYSFDPETKENTVILKNVCGCDPNYERIDQEYLFENGVWEMIKNNIKKVSTE